MEVQVNKELCEGCGICISACPAGAISLVDGIAEIDKALCTQCFVCIKVCPKSAVSSTELPEQVNLKVLRVVPEHETIIAEPVLPPFTHPFSVVLSSVGSVLLPRLADVLINALERHFIQSEKNSLYPTSQNPVVPIRQSGRGYQRRIRGGSQWHKTKEIMEKFIKKGGE